MIKYRKLEERKEFLKGKIKERTVMELRQMILEGTLAAFNEKGLKFTMDDVARILGMSKKTIYTVFRDKKELFLAMVDFLFDSIKMSEQKVVDDPDLTTEEKVRKILGVMPDTYKDIDFRQLYMLREKYPDTYRRVEERLESGWETTIQLMEQGMEEGVLRRVSIPMVKLMLEASLEQFFQRDILIRCGMTYKEALDNVIGILMDGISQREKQEDNCNY